MASTEIQLTLYVWGPRLDPAALTASTGVVPSRHFQVGERRGAAANVVAGWEWSSDPGSDDEPMFQNLLSTLGPHTGELRACRDEGASIWLLAAGKVRGDLIQSAEEAERRHWSVRVGPGETFEPILDVDRVGLMISEEAVQFLGSIGASFETHIDAVFEPFDG